MASRTALVVSQSESIDYTTTLEFSFRMCPCGIITASSTVCIIDRKNCSGIATGCKKKIWIFFPFNLSRGEIRSDYSGRSIGYFFSCFCHHLDFNLRATRYFFKRIKFVGRRGLARAPPRSDRVHAECVFYRRKNHRRLCVRVIYFNRFYYSPSRRKFTVLAWPPDYRGIRHVSCARRSSSRRL